MMPFEVLSPDIACEVLAEAGFEFAPSDVHVEAREERWVVRLPGSIWPGSRPRSMASSASRPNAACCACSQPAAPSVCHAFCSKARPVTLTSGRWSRVGVIPGASMPKFATVSSWPSS